MESSPQNDGLDAAQNAVTPATDKPVVKKMRPQKPFFFAAVVGLSFAGWYAWNHKYEIQAFCLNTSVAQQERISRGVTGIADSEFNTENLILSESEIHSGGVPKDGIPALTDPEFISVADATFMEPGDRLAGVVFEGQARAYPLKIMDMHEVVNDKIGKTSFAVTYCPLCDSLAVYNRKGPGGDLEFGVSGFLYNSNVLLYDRSGSSGTDGLWSQMMSQGIAGPRVKEKLGTMPVELTTWEDWKQRYPKTQVLSTDTGHPRDYSQRAYAPYFDDEMILMFQVAKEDHRLPNKSPLLGVWVGDKMRAYPVSAFQHLTESQELEQELGGKKFTLVYNPQANSLRVVNPDKDVRWMYSFWFAWYVFNTDTELFSAAKVAEISEVDKKQELEPKQKATTSEKAEKP
ncbi:MAG: DUF3179 domain-containing protein [Gimesia sp.]|nr:DUF3179 domain-containing protein [Gimesia sp.]